jgi:hypothetical protein
MPPSALVRRLATAPPYDVESVPPNSEVASLKAVGKALRAPDFAEAFPDLLLLEGHPEHAFKGAPFASRAVVYTFWIAVRDPRGGAARIRHPDVRCPAGAIKASVVRCRWRPRAASAELAREVYAEEGARWTPEAERDYASGGFARLLERRPQSLGLKLVAMHRELEALCQAPGPDADPPFPPKAVLALSLAQLRWAASLASEDRFRLCFRRAHGLELGDAEPGDAPLTERERAALGLYRRLRDSARERRSTLVPVAACDPSGLEWLLQNGVAERSPVDPSNFVGVAEAVEAERAIAEALAIVEAARAPPQVPRGTAGAAADPGLGSGARMCDEQLEALALLRTRQVVAIDGRAGSGKTDFLSAVARLYGPAATFFTAFQGVNAGRLAELSKNVFTTHKLLHAHAREHAGGGAFRPCRFRACSVLVVEEAATQPLWLLAQLLCAFAACGGASKKLVMVGDVGQLPPIGGPAPFFHLLPHLRASGELVSFTHNHRVREGARALADNANRVLAGRPDLVEWDREHFVFVAPDPSESFTDAAMRAAKLVAAREEDVVFVTQMNVHREPLCAAAERHFGGAGGHGACVGRKFCFTVNDYTRPVAVVNNEILLLLAIEDRPPKVRRGNVTFRAAKPRRARSTSDRKPRGHERFLLFRRADGSEAEVAYDGDLVGRVRKASAVTSNAMQGSSRPVVVRVDYCWSRHKTAEQLYTDVTRAEETFVYVGRKEWFDRAAKNREPETLSHLSRVAAAALGASSERA